jgi:hypothetical protein
LGALKGAGLGPALAAPAALPEFLTRLDIFVRQVIPGMVSVGMFLRGVLT